MARTMLHMCVQGSYDSMVVNTAVVDSIPLFDGSAGANKTLANLASPNLTFSTANLSALNISVNSFLGVTLGTAHTFSLPLFLIPH